MSAANHRVTIKGTKEGLVFVLDDGCPFSELLEELQHKLDNTHQQILTGPIVHVQVKLGARIATEEEKQQLKQTIGRKGNLFVQAIESSAEGAPQQQEEPQLRLVRGIVRSGQTIEHDGNVMIMGDVNAGGTVIASGDVYVLGSLRGMAHAGFNGDESAIIAASHMRPTQLRIAGIISRPPDEWGIEEAFMEFAYVKDGRMEIDKINYLHRIRPGTA